MQGPGFSGPFFLTGAGIGVSKKFKADVSQWSAASKRSIIADYKQVYEDSVYDCLSCGKKGCVYSAWDQKHDFEVR